MTRDTDNSEKNGSLYYPLFQNMFELADVTSSLWQPMFKAIGRTQLEFAGLQARQTRAFVHWMHQMTRPATPADFYNANAQFWTAILQDYLETTPRLTAAAGTAAEAVAPKVRETPRPKQTRDTLILLDRTVEEGRERKVA